MQKIHICAGSRQACHQRIFKHITGSSRILSYNHLCLVPASVIPPKETAHLKSMRNRQIYICLTAEPIRSKIFSHSSYPHYPLAFQILVLYYT